MNRVIPAISIKYGLYYTAFSIKIKPAEISLRLFDMIHDISREIEKKRQASFALPLSFYYLLLSF